MKLIYAGEMLGKYYCKNEERTGIFAVAWNVFKELIKQNNIEIVVYADVKRYCDIKE